MSLRRTVATTTLVVLVIAVLIAATLLVLTELLERTTAGAVESVESLRMAQAAQIDLLEHSRANDPLVVRSIEADLQGRLDRARSFVTEPDEARTLAKAQAYVNAYLTAVHEPSQTAEQRVGAQAAAYGALERLAGINLDQARAAQRAASRWNEVGNAIAIAAIVMLVLLAAGLLVWLKRRAFQPIFELAATVERFGAGDHDARAAERGPRELREMCRHFNAMASAIAAQRHAQTAFLGGVAHDLRTPLSTLQIAIELLLRGREPAYDHDLRRALERIRRQIKRMDRMLGDFLDGARIEAGLLELRIEVHDVRALVAEVVELFDGTSTHTLDVRLPAEPMPICCDRLRIEQVITNLISNAIKYSPAGSVVTIEVAAGPGELALSVRDHGVGISQDGLVDLFQPFRRVGLSSEAVPGVGLGLFVVRRIVEAHGGRIDVVSTLGSGSTFRVVLPFEPGQGQSMT